MVLKTEINPSRHYKKDIIEALTRFGLRYNNFKDVTRDDVISFLDSLRKSETVDPLHKWIGTYNTYRIHLVRFFKWYYSSDIELSKRPKPSVVDNIPKLKRKEKSIYKPSDLWTPEDDLLFLKYCPTKRGKCYHAVSRDLSCRPQELLSLKVKDITFKTTR
jgi:integrase